MVEGMAGYVSSTLLGSSASKAIVVSVPNTPEVRINADEHAASAQAVEEAIETAGITELPETSLSIDTTNGELGDPKPVIDVDVEHFWDTIIAKMAARHCM